MATRSQEWIDEHAIMLEGKSPEDMSLILDGSVEICPACMELSAYAFQDTTAYDEFPDGNPTEPFWKPKLGTIAHIAVCSGFEWQCGHCGVHVVPANSPINHPCYTHEDE
jgi:hypothetical protein